MEVILPVTAAPNSWDLGITVYTGSCGTFTCVDDGNIGTIDVIESVTFRFNQWHNLLYKYSIS